MKEWKRLLKFLWVVSESVLVTSRCDICAMLEQCWLNEVIWRSSGLLVDGIIQITFYSMCKSARHFLNKNNSV